MHRATAMRPPHGVRNRHPAHDGAGRNLPERGPLSIVIPLQRRIVGEGGSGSMDGEATGIDGDDPFAQLREVFAGRRALRPEDDPARELSSWRIARARRKSVP